MSVFGIIAVIGVGLIIFGSVSCLVYEVKKHGFDLNDFLVKLIIVGLVCIVIAFLLLMVTVLGAK